MPVRTFSETVDGMLKQLASTSNVTQLGPGSKARNLLEIIGAEITSLSREMATDLKQANPSQATQRNLERIGDIFNVSRKRRTKAFTTIADLNTRFFVDPSIGGFLGLPSLPNIQAGDRVSTRNQNTNIVYEISEIAGPINPNSLVYYVGVQAIQSGSSFNIGRDTLTSHTQSIAGLQVTNRFPIVNGTDDETNESLRFRQFHAVRSLATANDRAVFVAARLIPGVGDVAILPYLFGIGTTAVVVRPLRGSVTPESILAAVRSSVGHVAPSSSRVIVTAPDLLGFEFEIVLNYRKAMTATELSIVESRVLGRINNYFSSLSLGDAVSFRTVSELVLGADPNIKSIGKEPGTLGRSWVYKTQVPGRFDSRRREELLLNQTSNNFPIEKHAWAILEESISSPVSIVHSRQG